MAPKPDPRRGWFRGLPVVLYASQPAVQWPEHPLASSTGYVTIARIIATERLGRPLLPHERVTWIDGNRLNVSEHNIEIKFVRAGWFRKKR